MLTVLAGFLSEPSLELWCQRLKHPLQHPYETNKTTPEGWRWSPSLAPGSYISWRPPHVPCPSSLDTLLSDWGRFQTGSIEVLNQPSRFAMPHTPF